ncbi:unnamed protein product [Sympodiomycopsis kandeliae]
MSSSQAHRQASSTLSHPPSRGTLYRRSAMVLNSVTSLFTGGSNATAADEQREPLLQQEVEQEEELGTSSGRRTYGSTSNRRRNVPKPPTVKSPVRVEAKVWLANERTWISWLHISLLIGSFALALFNSADFFSHHHPDLPEDPTKPRHPKRNNALEPSTIRVFGLVYAGIAILTLSWGLGNYLRRLHLIKTKYAGSFDDLIGPPLICVALFLAVLLNFIVRVQQHNIELPVPGN